MTETYSILSYDRINPVAPRPDDDDPRPELADVGRLVRRAVRGVVGAARAEQRVTLSSLLRDHLGADNSDRAVVEEVWPQYDHVNVQAGLDAWLNESPVTHELIGVIGFQHRDFGLAELLEVTRAPGYGPAMSPVPIWPADPPVR